MQNTDLKTHFRQISQLNATLNYTKHTFCIIRYMIFPIKQTKTAYHIRRFILQVDEILNMTEYIYF